MSEHKHAARAIQIDRHVEKKTYTHDTYSWKQANKEGMCVRKTEAIISRAPRLGIHIWHSTELGVSPASGFEEYERTNTTCIK